MTLLAFLGALSLSVLAFELLSTFQNAFSVFGNNRLMSLSTTSTAKRRSTWEALLVAILPGRFDPEQAKNMTDVISLLRRAGYPYDTPGEFYAVALSGGVAKMALKSLAIPAASHSKPATPVSAQP
jgi:hypothetical protein